MVILEEVIEIFDVELEVFLFLFKFFYFDEVTICLDIVMTILYIVKKYVVFVLERVCVEFLKRNLSSDNVFMLLI